jgi:hypothetical protein
MATLYQFRRNRSDPTLWADIILFFGHVEALNIDLQAFEIKPDGTINVRVATALDPDQVQHLGLA